MREVFETDKNGKTAEIHLEHLVIVPLGLEGSEYVDEQQHVIFHAFALNLITRNRTF